MVAVTDNNQIKAVTATAMATATGGGRDTTTATATELRVERLGGHASLSSWRRLHNDGDSGDANDDDDCGGGGKNNGGCR
jgi:hypothetical protein